MCCRNMIGSWLNRSPFSFSKRRSLVCVENQGNRSYEGTPEKAPPASRRRTMPHTPQQSSHSSIEAMQWQNEMEDQESLWSARERSVVARMEQYLNASDCMKLEIDELELLLCPEDSEVNLRHLLRNASRRSVNVFVFFAVR